MRQESPSESRVAFDAWFERFLEDYLRRRPVNATFLGARHYDAELPNFSLEADADLIAHARDQIAALDAIPFEGLTEIQVFDRALARAFLEIQLWETGSPFFQAGNPAHHTSEAVFSVISLFRRAAEPLDERVDAAIQRMRKLPDFLATARSRMTKAPLVWTERAIRESAAGMAYFGEGLRLLGEEQGIDRPEFLRQAERAAQACDEHKTWLSAELYERRIRFRPAGTEVFDFSLNRGHFLPAEQTTEWWFDYAHAELIETTQELRELANAIDWKRSARQQLNDLADQHPQAADYYGAFGSAWRRRRQQAIDAELVSWPEVEVEFRPIPRSDRRAAEGLRYPLYRCPPPFGDPRDDRMFVPPCDPEMSPDAQHAVLRRINSTHIELDFAVRDAGLGRHVQSQHAIRSGSRVGQIAGVEGASRVAMNCGGALAGGWPCYALELMEEIGALTPEQRLAEAQHRVRIAARAVADTAIHSGEFSIERAARFLRDEAAMPASAALEEAVSISMFPTTRLLPLVGVAAIDELRRQIEDREGASFSLQSFHDRLLSYGAIPVTLIAASMLEATSPPSDTAIKPDS